MWLYVLSVVLYVKSSVVVLVVYELFEGNCDKLVILLVDVWVFILWNEVKNFGSKDLFDSLLMVLW